MNPAFLFLIDNNYRAAFRTARLFVRNNLLATDTASDLSFDFFFLIAFGHSSLPYLVKMLLLVYY
jgi:hypothetical protein